MLQSVKDQTLDQQCTVTRPGIAAIASALLVELLVSILQHPLRARAPATTDKQQAPAVTTAPDLATDTNSHQPKQPSSTSPHSSTPANQSSESSVPDESSASTFTHPLGMLPHTIRGFLSNFANVPFVGRPYDCCSACSQRILNAYEEDGWEFVKRAIGEKDYVEELSGLAEVQRRAEEAIAGMDIEDEEDAEALEEEGEMI